MHKYDFELEKFLLENGYYNIRFLEDGCIANFNFMYTTAVVLDINFGGYGGRHCYSDRALAAERCLIMQSIEDKPVKGCTAIKGRGIDVNGDEVLKYIEGN